jgi:phospholipid transport system substrate-binding protein
MTMTRSNEPDGPRFNRRFLLGVTLLGLSAARSGLAQSADIKQGIVDLYEALRATMRMGTAVPFQQRFDRIALVIDRVFDLETILRSSVGLRWSSLDEPSRKTLTGVFRTFTIASYAANFDKDGGEKFEVLAQVRTSGTDQVVQSRLVASNGEPIRIDYVMRSGPQGWRVVDVLLDGSISRVAVQRSDFRALLASGDSGPLIESLKRKITELSGGTMRP